MKKRSKRNPLFDYWRSLFMLFVFFHHFYLTLNEFDYFKYLNPFAELFVGLAGFMVGYIYLHREKDSILIKRGGKVIGAYYLAAIPISLFLAYLFNESLILSFINVILFNDNDNMIQILKFYGLLFISLPVLLKVYRKNSLLAMIISILLFIVSTAAFSKINTNIPFITYTISILLQWQLFFIIGLKIGELYKRGSLRMDLLYKFSIIIGITALFVHILLPGMPKVKVPYNFQKLLNAAYLVPIYLYILYWTYIKIKGTKIQKVICVIGRNSLAAFVISEIIRFWFIQLPFGFSGIELSIGASTWLSLLLSVLLVPLLVLYEKVKKPYLYKKLPLEARA